jgi:hypothetical protein
MPNHRWPLTGVVDPRALPELPDRISDAGWQQAIEMVKAELHCEPPADLRTRLDRALLTYHTVSALSRQSSPKTVKAKLQRLLDTAMKVNSALNELDGTSVHLITKISILGLAEMRATIGAFIETASKALLVAEELKPRGRMTDFAILNMGSELADAVAEHFGERMVVSTEDSLFAGLLETLLHEATGKEPKESGKAVRRIRKFWRDGRT